MPRQEATASPTARARRAKAGRASRMLRTIADRAQPERGARADPTVQARAAIANREPTGASAGHPVRAQQPIADRAGRMPPTIADRAQAVRGASPGLTVRARATIAGREPTGASAGPAA